MESFDAKSCFVRYKSAKFLLITNSWFLCIGSITIRLITGFALLLFLISCGKQITHAAKHLGTEANILLLRCKLPGYLLGHIVAAAFWRHPPHDVQGLLQLVSRLIVVALGIVHELLGLDQHVTRLAQDTVLPQGTPEQCLGHEDVGLAQDAEGAEEVQPDLLAVLVALFLA